MWGWCQTRDVTDLSRRHLRLAIAPTFTAYLVGPLIAELRNRHPGIAATVREMTKDVIETQLLADEVGIGIAFDHRHLPGVMAARLFAETLVAVVGLTTASESITAQELGQHPLALQTSDFATRGHIDAYFAQHRVTPTIAMETTPCRN